MNKRAELTLLRVGTILAGILVAFILVMIVYKATSQEGAESAFLAKDSAMFIDAILSTPQDVQIVYPEEFIKWYIRLDNLSVSIFHSQPEPNETSPYSYYFVPRADIKVQGRDLKLSTLFFIKSGDNFTISNIPEQGRGKLND